MLPPHPSCTEIRSRAGQPLAGPEWTCLSLSLSLGAGIPLGCWGRLGLRLCALGERRLPAITACSLVPVHSCAMACFQREGWELTPKPSPPHTLTHTHTRFRKCAYHVHVLHFSHMQVKWSLRAPKITCLQIRPRCRVFSAERVRLPGDQTQRCNKGGA